jgi:hypothetical protein
MFAERQGYSLPGALPRCARRRRNRLFLTGLEELGLATAPSRAAAGAIPGQEPNFIRRAGRS